MEATQPLGRVQRFMPLAMVNPLYLINNRLEELREASQDANRIVLALTAELGRGGSLAERIARGVSTAAARPWMRRAVRLSGAPLEPRALKQLMMQLSILMHLASLTTASLEARLASIYLYAGAKLLEAGPKPGAQAEELVQCYIDAGRLLLQGHKRQALSKLGHCLREVLPVKVPEHAGPDAWAGALTLSHILDVAPYTSGRLLEAWGYYEILDQIENSVV